MLYGKIAPLKSRDQFQFLYSVIFSGSLNGLVGQSSVKDILVNILLSQEPLYLTLN